MGGMGDVETLVGMATGAVERLDQMEGIVGSPALSDGQSSLSEPPQSSQPEQESTAEAVVGTTEYEKAPTPEMMEIDADPPAEIAPPRTPVREETATAHATPASDVRSFTEPGDNVRESTVGLSHLEDLMIDPNTISTPKGSRKKSKKCSAAFEVSEEFDNQVKRLKNDPKSVCACPVGLVEQHWPYLPRMYEDEEYLVKDLKEMLRPLLTG
jgi:hypothetical protein